MLVPFQQLASSRDARIEFIEQDSVVSLDATQNNATWGLDRIDQRDRPLNGSYVYDVTASNVRAYIIDSGIRASHSDFGGRVLSGYTAINDGRGTNDCNGHGTHVAGTVGGATWGVAKSVRLVPVRVFGCTGGSSNSIILAGINWVAANAVRPAVANMSLGGGASSTTDSATNNLINSGVTVVVAAGNSGANACNYSPARVANAITVGSTTSSDARSNFSNYGSCVNVFAPGSSIRSAWYTSNTATNTISGTSDGIAACRRRGCAVPVAEYRCEQQSGIQRDRVPTPPPAASVVSAPGRPIAWSIRDSAVAVAGLPAAAARATPARCPVPVRSSNSPMELTTTQAPASIVATCAAQVTPISTSICSAGTVRAGLRSPAVPAPAPVRTLVYNGSAGYYTWLIHSASGGGSYTFYLDRP